MRLRKITFVLLALFGLPAGASAGEIQFGYSTGNITTSSGAPALGMTLRPFQPPGPVFTFDPAANRPVTLPAVSVVPALLPAPAARDIHPDGTTHWNNDGYFGVDVQVVDFASWESATLHFNGRAHMYNSYTTAGGWSGVTYFWFQNYAQVTLGGNEYTVWNDKVYAADPATVNVWVGPNPPVSNTPEPGTFALVALGLVPFGLRRIRKWFA